MLATRFRSLLLATLFLAPAGILEAQVTGGSRPAATAVAAAVAPVVDGRLDDDAWREAQVLSGMVQREPLEGTPVSERTEVRIVYDDEALYVGAWLYDGRPESLVFGQTLRDASLDDADAFLVVLDTYRDGQNGFAFGTTPAGIEYDGQFSNEGGGGGGGRGGGIGRQQSGSGGGFNLNWDGSWEVATTTDGEGWYAEMRIPFATLRYGEGGPQTWGLNFQRNIRRNNELSVWAPLPRQFEVYRVSLAGSLDLQAPTSRIATVSPYVLSDVFKDYSVASPEADFGTKVGGDAKIGLNQSLTLDLTVNTDFAQAEVDDQQVNLTRFSLFFPEKRGFFLENAGTFSVGAGRSAELFFSRRIGLAGGQEVPIHGGARLTGKLGGMQLGLLNIQTGDAFELDAVTGTPQQVAPDNNFGVVRAFQEFDNRTRIGAIVVSRINTGSPDDYNLTYGVDGRLGIGEDVTFDGWAGLTTTPIPDGTPDTRSGFNNGEYGFSVGGEYLTRDWESSLGYRQIGEDFNPEVGFVNRREYRRVNARVLYHWRTEGVSWFREFRPHASWEQYWSLGGFSESYLVHLDNHFQFENGALFQLPGFNFTGEGLEVPFEIRPGIVIPAGSYNNVEWQFRSNTNRSSPLSFSAGWTLGGFYTGTQFSPDAQLSYRFRDQFTASVRLNYFDVRLDEGDFSTAVLGFNGSYAFTPRLYLQANVQYNDDTEDIGTNVRLGWLDTAGTGLFIVYNDTEHIGSLARTGIPGGARQRQIVIKYTRLFDLTR
ncbi:MAG: carbohydrate binding family 9 domain-containing protein [Gemmatimonadota bacterium]|nr:carbohydrate binding family 9 domain-containing protein [Gemmatimonadota bacterium]